MNTINKIEFTRINNDTCGNPRYVCHFYNLVNDKDRDELTNVKIHSTNNPAFFITELYKIAVKRANKLGGRKFHNKQYGGGIVFQSYNIQDLEQRIHELVQNS